MHCGGDAALTRDAARRFDSERKKEKEGDPSAVPPQLMREIGPALRTMQSLARRVATVMMECKIDISPDDYVAKVSCAVCAAMVIVTDARGDV